ncbi:MAG: hypothetical protein ACI8P9_001592 [Parasphingorhabdus sp.]|jgi:hypothetical protein
MSQFQATIVIPLLEQNDKYLFECITSSLNQTILCEVIIVCSPNTPMSNHNVINEISKSNSSLKKISGLKTDSFAKAINLGVEQSVTERIGLLLSDDWLEANAIERCLKFDVDIVSTGQNIVLDDGELFATIRLFNQVFQEFGSLQEKASYLEHFFMFRKSKFLEVGGVDDTIGLTGPDDYDLIWCLLEHGASLQLISEPLYNYRDHDGIRLSLKEPSIQIRSLQKTLNKHHVIGLERQRIIESHAQWFGVTVRQALAFEDIQISPISLVIPPQIQATKTFHATQLGSQTGQFQNAEIFCRQGYDTPDHCVFGPGYKPEWSEELRVTFTLKLQGYLRTFSPLITLDVYDQISDQILIIEPFSSQCYESKPCELIFMANPGQSLEFRVYWHGTSELHFSQLTLSGMVENEIKKPETVAGQQCLVQRVTSPNKSTLSTTYDRYHSQFDNFIKVGLNRYFDHTVLFLDKSYPDTHLIFDDARMIQNGQNVGAFIQVNIYASDTEWLPEAIWSDLELNWHRQQMSERGLVASAGMFLPNASTVVISLIQSDLLQQLFRHPQYASYETRIKNRYRAWYKMLFNAIMSYAIDNHIDIVYSPTSETVAKRTLKPINLDIFHRFYDYPPRHYTCNRSRLNDQTYWSIKPHENRQFVACLKPGQHYLKMPKTFCLMHDIEGNVDTDIPLEQCLNHLRKIVAVERELGIPATFNLLGKYFKQFMEILQSHEGADFGFHSYDHCLENLSQLNQVRNINLKLKGYRPPQSVLTEELTDYNLSYQNFDWLASSASSLGFHSCRIENGIVKIPIMTDDYPLHTGELSFEDWSDDILKRVSESDFCAISLHDCYAEHWLQKIKSLLEEIGKTHEFATCSNVAAKLFISSSRYKNPYDL